MVYELEFTFDHPGNHDNKDNKVFGSIKDMHIRDALNKDAKITESSSSSQLNMASKPSFTFNNNAVHPCTIDEENEQNTESDSVAKGKKTK